MDLYPSFETGDNHRLQYVAEVRFRLEKERDFKHRCTKKDRRGANVADRIVTTCFCGQRGFDCLGCRTALDDHRGACRHRHASRRHHMWFAWSRRKIYLPVVPKARLVNMARFVAWPGCETKHNSRPKLNTIADRISTALTDDKISDEEFRLILSEVDKYYNPPARLIRIQA